MGRIRGTMVGSDLGQKSVVILNKQVSNGIHWTIPADNIDNQQMAADCLKL